MGTFIEKHMGKIYKRKKTSINKAFGLQVRVRRFALNWTQEDLAEKSHLNTTYLGSVERGERNVSLEKIIAIAKALGCSPRDLIPE